MASRLFAPLQLGPVSLANRILVAPMCQYSAEDGNATHWHTVHLGSLAISGAGLLCLEATGVSAEGRITYGCLGLYSDANEAALAGVLAHLRAVAPVPLAIQLSHAGRKASSRAPWDGGSLIPAEQGGWTPLAPSALPLRTDEAAPRAMTASDIDQVVEDFAKAAVRARRLGLDAIELHMAHGYLMHQFLSPIANRREDEYGGSLENRMRLPLRVFDAVREACGSGMALGIRLSATDWVDGGWDPQQSVVLCRELDRRGCDFFHISSGGLSPAQKITVGPGYQVHLAETIKQEVKAPVIAVGMITEPAQAESIIANGQADAIAMARGMLANPRWPWQAALALDGKVNAPKQYWRSLPAGASRVFGNIDTGQR
ncbi:MAG: flavin oxidoreductase / oxidase family protein [Paucimonas sp.]|nr:flavin oxidoreductase / oxidase family protein [Paucimonas sp.]